jgi:hypothetical protein
MAILTTSGRTALAQSVANQSLHLAWGTGDAAWDSVAVPEPTSATALLSEVGRRASPQLLYVTQDAAGELALPSGRWKISGTPTNNLYMRFAFDYADGATASIRELGVFVGTVIKASVLSATPGKLYFEPTDLQSPGTLLALQRVPKITRSPATRQAFEFVLTL